MYLYLQACNRLFAYHLTQNIKLIMLVLHQLMNTSLHNGLCCGQ